MPEETRTRIIQATMRLFNQYGPMVPMAKISQAAGVGAGTPFKYFKTKDELLQATYHYARESAYLVNRESPADQPDAEGIVKAIIRGILRWSALCPQELQYVRKYEDMACYDCFSPEFSRLYVGIIQELDIWDRIRDQVRPDMPKELVSRLISINCAVFSRYALHMAITADSPQFSAFLDTCASSLWNSIRREN